MAYDNSNRWTLNKNARKTQDSHADYTGKIDVNGVEYWLNGWIKDGPKGKFISGTIKRRDAEALIGGRMEALGEPNPRQSISERAQDKIRKPDPITSGQSLYDDDIPF
jgi:hypothetical protein